MRLLNGFIAALSLVVLSGCGNPCEELADLSCTTSGEDSAECKTIREKAGKASSEDKRACDSALELVKSLERPR